MGPMKDFQVFLLGLSFLSLASCAAEKISDQELDQVFDVRNKPVKEYFDDYQSRVGECFDWMVLIGTCSKTLVKIGRNEIVFKSTTHVPKEYRHFWDAIYQHSSSCGGEPSFEIYGDHYRVYDACDNVSIYASKKGVLKTLKLLNELQ